MTEHRSQSEPHREPLAELREVMWTYRADAWTVVLYAACVGLLALATPIAVQALVNTAAFGTVLQPVIVLVLLLLLGLMVAALLKALKTWAVEVLQRRMFVDTVARLAYRLPRADADAISNSAGGHLVHRFFDLFTVQKASAALLLGGVDVMLAASLGLLVLAFYHPLLLAFDVVLISCLVLIVFVLGRGGVRTSLDESTHKYEIAGFLAQVASARYAYRERGGLHYARDRLDTLSQGYLQARQTHFRVVMRQYVGALATQVIASAGLLGVGGWLVIERELTLGQLVAAELIVTTVVSTLSDLGKHVETYYDLVTGVHKLESLLSVSVERDEENDHEAGSVVGGPTALMIQDLCVDLGTRRLFDAASLQLSPAARVALAGPAESGKSYLLDLLFRMRRADRGRLTLNGVDVREMSLHTLREQVAVVRGPELVPGTVIDNVRLARPDISPGRVRALLDQLGLADELGRLPDGLDTVVGPGGAAISTSQAWRLTLARAAARTPGLLAIDADLSSIDPASLERVLRVVSRADAPWTLIIVSENPLVLRHCTQMVRLHEGQFVPEVLA